MDFDIIIIQQAAVTNNKTFMKYTQKTISQSIYQKGFTTAKKLKNI